MCDEVMVHIPIYREEARFWNRNYKEDISSEGLKEEPGIWHFQANKRLRCY